MVHPLPLPLGKVAEQARTEGVRKTAKPSQSPSVTALPEGEPRRSMMEREMERIFIDTLH